MGARRARTASCARPARESLGDRTLGDLTGLDVALHLIARGSHPVTLLSRTARSRAESAPPARPTRVD